MKWLNDYVKADMPAKEFADKMTMGGSKVETYHNMSEPISNIVVAKVISLERHPDSDKLWICQLDAGQGEPVQIVTAAQNLFEGAIVSACMHNSTLADGTKITKGKLRGVVSNGMMCSYEELGLTPGDFSYFVPDDGILILNEDPDIDKMKPGMDIREALEIDDTIVEFEITNNRPDCLSVLGLAQEAAAVFDTPLNYTEPTYTTAGGNINDELKVTVENKELCSRYMAAMVKNVKIGPSPRWMARRLRASGVRPINNLVDITNFVMLEYGHPMHAFDLRYVEDNTITVRNAKEGETLKLLDEMAEPVKLSPEMLIIADGKKPIAIAGVMGGEHSGIMDDTTTVVFEAACFDGVSVRRTAKKVGERTEASSRFEKGLNPVNAEKALKRALQLIEMLGCGEIVDGIIDAKSGEYQPERLKLDCDRVNELLGANIPADEQKSILKRLGFGIEGDELIVPPTRIDMHLPCDIAEEVARIYGYNNIASTVPKLSGQGRRTERQKFEDKATSLALSLGFYEIMTYSFISPKDYELLGMKEEDRKSVVIRNPLGEDTSVMRTSPLTSMMEVIRRNYNNRNLSARFFETARAYFPNGEGELPDEKDYLCLGLYGAGEDFFTIKGAVEEILDKLGIEDVQFTADSENPVYHPGRCAKVTAGDKELGYVGQIHPRAAGAFDVGCEVYCAVLDIDKAQESAGEDVKYVSLPKFPAAARDLSLICADEVTNGEITAAIRSSAKHLEAVKLFDIYKGEQVPEGKKSLSYTLTFRKKDATLTDEEADASVAKVLKALEAIGVTLR
ncbi:MAG: phenylalanine--tRNA ligase subunit beta [Eubacterium sp.]|nr:phenylalanine--tRNA ligase subunit beta [Eubacterium sp.]